MYKGDFAIAQLVVRVQISRYLINEVQKNLKYNGKNKGDGGNTHLDIVVKIFAIVFTSSSRLYQTNKKGLFCKFNKKSCISFEIQPFLGVQTLELITITNRVTS